MILFKNHGLTTFKPSFVNSIRNVRKAGYFTMSKRYDPSSSYYITMGTILFK